MNFFADYERSRRLYVPAGFQRVNSTGFPVSPVLIHGFQLNALLDPPLYYQRNETVNSNIPVFDDGFAELEEPVFDETDEPNMFQSVPVSAPQAFPKSKEIRESFRSMFFERFHVKLEFGSDHCGAGIGHSSYDEREDRSQSSGHESMATLVRRLARQSGIEIYPRNVGVEGIWGMADMLLVSGDRYLFVEVQSDHALQDSQRLGRKLVLRNYHPLLFVVSPLADVNSLLDKGVSADAILVADPCRNAISLLSSYRGIECIFCGALTMANGLDSSSSLQSPICLRCGRRQSPARQALDDSWDKLPRRIRSWLISGGIDERIRESFMEKGFSDELIRESFRGKVWRERYHNRRVSVAKLARDSDTYVRLYASVEGEWCSLCHRKPGKKSKRSVYAEERCGGCGKVQSVRETCCALCESSFPHKPDWTSKRTCHLCGYQGCIKCVPLVSGLTREELHPRYVSVKRFMEIHDRMGMRWKGGEIDFFENMPIIVLLYPKKWTEYLEKVGISLNKQLNWRRKLVDEIVKELGRPQELEEDCFSSQVVFHRTKNRCETIGEGHVCKACSKKFPSLRDQLEAYRRNLLKRFERLSDRLPAPKVRSPRIFKNPWIHLVPNTVVHAEALECSGNVVRLKLLSECGVQNCRQIPVPELQKVPRLAPVGTEVRLEWSYLSRVLKSRQLPSAIWIRTDSLGAKDLRLKEP